MATTYQPKMIQTDYYGTLPVGTYRKLRKANVSPSDFDALTQRLGDDWKRIERNIEAYSQDGMFNEYKFWSGGNVA